MSGSRADRAGPDWIAVDWGTSNLRAWAMDADGRVMAEAASADGMGGLASPDAFAPALLKLVGDWLPPEGLPGGLSDPVPTVICGMAGARTGWVEAPYLPVPCAPLDPARAASPDAGPRLSVRILPGLSQAKPADVMRGEETQIAGLIARRPRFDGVVCLPGTHTKWAHVSAEEVVSFRSFMTGELFALLSSASILRHGLAEEGGHASAGEDFAEALDAAMSRPEAAAASLFALRAEHLLHDLAPARARARLSGLLIGLELAASRPWWLGREVALIGAPGPTAGYAAALEAQGVFLSRLDPAEATLDGLRAAHAALWPAAEAPSAG
ncbi:MAG: 2-dehydro-3-deoxygalactonokinase [Pseudomonadota bacterium]|nr:2-dehydro-3-deoxygalactonokinase [Pseudomonadota bacterium]